MTSPKIQPIGVCRFSLLTTERGGFKDGPVSLEERAAYLFEERRMAVRMAWFTHVLMPSIRAQTDQDFIFVVLASSLMPQKWQDLLTETVKDCAAIRLDFVEPGLHFEVCNSAFHRHTSPDADIIAQFRLDDDDALARDYISRVRGDFHAYMAPLYQRFEKIGSDYTSGFILDADASKAELHHVHISTWTCGQTIYLPPHSAGSLFVRGHHELHKHMPTLTLNDSNMFLRGRNGTNDSGAKLPHNTRPWNLDALARRFDINLTHLQKALQAIPDKEQ